MILAKTANESTYFSVFNHCLKFWTLNFSAPQLLQKTFAPHSCPLTNVCIHSLPPLKVCPNIDGTPSIYIERVIPCCFENEGESNFLLLNCIGTSPNYYPMVIKFLIRVSSFQLQPVNIHFIFFHLKSFAKSNSRRNVLYTVISSYFLIGK